MLSAMWWSCWVSGRLMLKEISIYKWNSRDNAVGTVFAVMNASQNTLLPNSSKKKILFWLRFGLLREKGLLRFSLFAKNPRYFHGSDYLQTLTWWRGLTMTLRESTVIGLGRTYCRWFSKWSSFLSLAWKPVADPALSKDFIWSFGQLWASQKKASSLPLALALPLLMMRSISINHKGQVTRSNP